VSTNYTKQISSRFPGHILKKFQYLLVFDVRYWYSKSVYPLHSGIRWKRLNISSQFFHHTVAQSL